MLPIYLLGNGGIMICCGGDDSGGSGDSGYSGSVEDADAGPNAGNYGDVGSTGYAGDSSFSEDGQAAAYGTYSGWDFSTYGWGDPSVGYQGSQEAANAEHAALEQAALEASGAKGTNAWAITNVSEEDQLAANPGALGAYASQEALDAANAEYNSLGWSGALQGNSWSFTDALGNQNTNWGSVGRDTASVIGQYGGLVGGLTGYGAIGAGIGALANLALGESGRGLGSLGSIFGGPTGALAGSVIGNMFQGNERGALNSLISSGLGYGLGQAGVNLGQAAWGLAGGRENATTSQLAGMLGNWSQGQAVGQASNWGAGALAGLGLSDALSSSISSSTGSGWGTSSSSTGTDSGNYSGGTSPITNSQEGTAMTTAVNGTDWLSTLAGLYSGYQSNQAGSTISNNVSSLMDKLNESYTNPQGIFDTQYSALDKAFYNDLQAQNAQAGRATDAYKTGVAREAAFQNWLSQYRQGLVQNAQGLAANRTTAANAEGQGIYALQSLLGGGTRSNTGTGTGSTTGSLLNGISSAVSGAGDWLSSLFNYGNTVDGQNVVDWYNQNYGDYVDPSVADPVMQQYYDQGESSDTSWMDYWS